MKNILILTYTDDGGAGIATVNFARALRDLGHNVTILVRVKKSDVEFVEEIKKTVNTNLKNRIVKKIQKKIPFLKRKLALDEKYFFFLNDDQNPFFQSEDIIPYIHFPPDIIIGSWLSYLTNFENIGILARKFGAKAYVLTMDMGNLTGGCHYAWDCEGYKKNCQSCPAIKNTNSLKKLASRNLSNRMEAVAKYNINVISCSLETQKQAKSSILFKNQLDIKRYNGIIDFEIFNPKNRETSRNKLKFNEDSRIILVGSADINDKRKGFDKLVEALHILDKMTNNKIQLIVISKVGELKENFKNIEVIHYGFIEDSAVLADLYRSANVYISSSVQDSGPVMVLQALACGTPVVGFEVGFVMEYIENGKNGFICRNFNTNDMAKNTLQILNSKNNFWSENAHNSVKTKLTSEQLSNFF